MRSVKVSSLVSIVRQLHGNVKRFSGLEPSEQ